MNDFTTYHSACGAVSLAIQADKGPQEAFDYVASIWDVGPADGDCGATLLAALLRGADLPCEAYEDTPINCGHIVRQAYQQGRIAFYQIKPSGNLTGPRWGTLQSATSFEVVQALLVGPRDLVTPSPGIEDDLTGHCVVLDDPIPFPNRIMAYVLEI